MVGTAHPTAWQARSLPHKLLAGLLEVVDAFFVGGDDVEEAVGVDVGDFELRADAAIVIDFVGLPARLAAGAAELEPEQDGRIAGVEVPLGAVGPKPLARDEIELAVAVHAGDTQRMGLGEAIVNEVRLPFAFG